ncbi:MAG: hypothetical protein JO189_30930 [Deltaproteobacteria bacterium]|nr:hypothetical protein [Deltaproteobacteria bacterium]
MSLASSNGSAHSQWSDERISFDVVRYWVLLKSWRWAIVLTTAAAVLTTLIVAKYVLIKQYRAIAIIKPISHKSGLAAAAGALLGGESGIGGMFGQGLFGGVGQPQDRDPEELMAMMRSYAFTMALVKKYNLAPHLLAESPLGKLDPRSGEWRLYKIMKARFICDFDYRSELINAYFSDPDPLFAERVLGYYVDTLRSQLRNQTVGGATVAIQSLEEEATRTQDVLLKSELYQLIAEQIEDQKRAQMDADYSFRVIEPPIAPPEKYFPSVAQFCLLALLLTPIVMIAGLFTHAFVVKTLQTLRMLEQNANRRRDDRISLHDDRSGTGAAFGLAGADTDNRL